MAGICAAPVRAERKPERRASVRAAAARQQWIAEEAGSDEEEEAPSPFPLPQPKAPRSSAAVSATPKVCV